MQDSEKLQWQGLPSDKGCKSCKNVSTLNIIYVLSLLCFAVFLKS